MQGGNGYLYIRGAFHNNVSGFSGFGFRRKLAHTKTQQDTDKVSKNNGCTVFSRDLISCTHQQNWRQFCFIIYPVFVLLPNYLGKLLKKLLRHCSLGGTDTAHRVAQSGRRRNVSTSFKIIMSVYFSCRSRGHWLQLTQKFWFQRQYYLARIHTTIYVVTAYITVSRIYASDFIIS